MLNDCEKVFLNSEIEKKPTLEEQKMQMQIQKMQMQIDLLEFKKQEANRKQLEKIKKEEEKQQKEDIKKQILKQKEREQAFKQTLKIIECISIVLLSPILLLGFFILAICKNVK